MKNYPTSYFLSLENGISYLVVYFKVIFVEINWTRRGRYTHFGRFPANEPYTESTLISESNEWFNGAPSLPQWRLAFWLHRGRLPERGLDLTSINIFLPEWCVKFTRIMLIDNLFSRQKPVIIFRYPMLIILNFDGGQNSENSLQHSFTSHIDNF